MIAPIRFRCFSYDLGCGRHNFGKTTSLNAALVAAKPPASAKLLADLKDVASDLPIYNVSYILGDSSSTLFGDDVILKPAGTATVGPFQYVVLHNSGVLICYWDRGKAITLDGAFGDEFRHEFEGRKILTIGAAANG